ncbi:DUF5801 repeats-in-toxin domain-containing protein [Mesorhizobium sp. VK22B]|uniref:DUF5801 repeats-in-toxin domain-containing protein n=1 Tax=Mesorhizobium captivum TaxID=3072319 RepID=A0ABU4YY22_9HYPH|nr:DUF5801 repeats-in-toxin domain-containing protein [Mesorhizobium sp. VK22B]MDX8491863.1 DUF5801 repeats-in-toxin domain-containing protein [Mesorhizobium sp. VK22B]
MALTINVFGSTKIDETTGLQDNDVALASVPSNVSTAFSNAGVTLASAIQIAGGGGDDLSVTPDSGFTVNGLGFVDATNGALDGDASGLFTLEGREIFLYASPNDDNVVLGREGTAGGLADPNGALVFAIYVEETTTNSLITGGKFWTVLFEPLKHTDNNDHDFTVNLDNKLKVAATQTTTFSFDNAPSGANEFMMFGNNPAGVSTSGIVVTGRAPDPNTEDNNSKGFDTVTSSQAGPHATVGVNGQHVGPGNGLSFTFVDNPAEDFTVAPQQDPHLPQGLDSTEADHESNIQFSGYTSGVTSASFTVAQVNPTGSVVTVKISAFNDPNGAAGETGTGFVEGFADDVAVNITEVKINGIVVAANLTGDTAVVSGIVNGDVVTYTTTSAHTRVLIENAQPVKGPGSNITLDIGGFTILSSQAASEFAGTQLQFDDDGPTITAVASTASVRHDETAGVQADTDVDGSAIAFGTTTIASLFTNVPSPGDDPDVAGTGAIGFARSTASLLTVTGSAGADGPGAQPLSYALSVVDGTDSGVETTAGTKIFMYNGTGSAAGLILGRVGTENAAGDTADPAGTVAFALATNPANGEVFLTQYLSLKHPTPGASYDETITLASGAVQMSVTRTDGDGDTATDSDNNIGLLVKFDDDGPTITAVTSGTASVRHDETPGVQADTDVDGTAIAFGSTTIASLFTNVPSPGDDPDVAGTGAIGFARSTDPLVTVTGGSAGADGPGAQPLSYALSVVDGTDSGVETTAGTKIFMYNGTGAAAGLILGRVGNELQGGDTANANGTVAFALATNPANGEVFLTQYLSLKHPTPGASYDETITLASGAVQMSVTRTDGDGDTATDSDNNIGLLVKFDDDGPTVTVNDSSGTFTAGAQGTWTEAPGADGFQSLSLALNSFEIDTHGTVTATPSNSSLTRTDNFHYSGSITADFTNDGIANNQTVQFTLTFDPNAGPPPTYDFELTTPPGGITTISSSNGSLDAGGPDPVRTLTIGTRSIVFSAVNATAAVGDIEGNLDKTESQIQTNPLPSYISSAAMNVSTSGIGLANNNFDGNALAGVDGQTTQGGAFDESFVIDPTAFLVSSMKVFIDNSVGGYDPTTEGIFYRTYTRNADNTVTAGAITKVASTDLHSEAGGQVSFVIPSVDQKNDLDAVQLFMGSGTVKVPVVEFSISTTFNPEPLNVNLTATLTDGDNDTNQDAFKITVA